MGKSTNFGALLKRYRQAAGLTQEGLAERAGLSARAISDLERGVNRAPRYVTLDLLASALPLSPQQRDLLKAAAGPETDLLMGVDPHPPLSIPSPPTRLIGREPERLQALELLRNGRTRLVTLTGPSGVGKTRLALQLAHDLAPEFTDGVTFIPLASLHDATLVPGMVAQALKIREDQLTSTQDLVLAFLQGKHLLLVLDNLEQILDCSPFVASLLSNCPHLTILAASRSALRLRAEQELLLAPLPLEDAVVLFCERLQVVQPGKTFPLDRVASICEQLDRLPLAIELAAMQGRLLPLIELGKRLTHRLALLRGGSRDLPPRQQTMETAIAWSYELLPEPQQRCFRALGIFVGSWTLEAAEAVCWAGDERAPEERLLILSGLVEASLIQTEMEMGAVRLSMLELVREYAIERLRAAGEVELYQRRHAVYYANLAGKAGALFDAGSVELNQSLVKELPNVQAALEWADTNREAGLGLQLSGFSRLWHMLGWPSQARYWLERMLALDLWARANGSPVAPLSLRIEKLYGLGRVLLSLGQMEDARAASTEALNLSWQAGDEKGLTGAWTTLGLIAQAEGRLEEAEKAFGQSVLHADKARVERLQYQSKIHLAELARGRGDLSRSASLLEEALTPAQISGMAWDVAIITTLLGHLARQQGNLPLAKERYREGLRRLSAFNTPTYTAWCLEGCAAVLIEEKRAIPTVRICATAARLRAQAGTPLPENEREVLEQVLLMAKDFLGEPRFQQEWAAGEALTQNEAIEIALDELK